MADVLARSGDPRAAAGVEGSRRRSPSIRSTCKPAFRASPTAPATPREVTALGAPPGPGRRPAGRAPTPPATSAPPSIPGRGARPTSSRTGSGRARRRSASSSAGRRRATTWTARPPGCSTTPPSGSTKMGRAKCSSTRSRRCSLRRPSPPSPRRSPRRARAAPAGHQARRAHLRAGAHRGEGHPHDAAPRGRRLPRDGARDPPGRRRREGPAVPEPPLVLPRGRQGLLAERVRGGHPGRPAARDRDARQGAPTFGEDRRSLRRATMARRPEPAGRDRAPEPSHHRVPPEREARLGCDPGHDARAARRHRGRPDAPRPAPASRGARPRPRSAGQGHRRPRAPALSLGPRPRPGRRGDRRPAGDHRQRRLASVRVPLPSPPARHGERCWRWRRTAWRRRRSAR